MQEWFSHYLAGVSADIYEKYQFLRPDYRKAMSVLRKKASEIVKTKGDNIAVLDVACGDAVATRQVFGNNRYANQKAIRFVGLDHDTNLLAEARRRWPPLLTQHADMVRSTLEDKFDIILCSFAYHHVPDFEKSALCSNLLKWCKNDGDLLVLEICLSANQIKKYYDEVKKKLRADPDRQECGRFLDWTMAADGFNNGEWKVSKAHMEKDFRQAGWKINEMELIWNASLLPANCGCYFFHFNPNYGKE
jgi:ubiquinone/menaquinone biosynthesis C-methylase UbiE